MRVIVAEREGMGAPNMLREVISLLKGTDFTVVPRIENIEELERATLALEFNDWLAIDLVPQPAIERRYSIAQRAICGVIVCVSDRASAERLDEMDWPNCPIIISEEEAKKGGVTVANLIAYIIAPN